MRRLNPGEQKLLSDIQAEDVALSRLPLGMLEKDVFVTEVTIALSTLSSDSVGVIFCGGTSLSKAHRIVSRMSEDIDFKIDVTDKSKAKNYQRTLLSDFKYSAVEKLRSIGYEIEDKDVIGRNSNKYIEINVPYSSSYPAEISIRPNLKVEFTASSPRVNTSDKTIATLVSGGNFSKIQGQVRTLDISETAAEKIVAFTRRTAAFIAGKNRGEYDKALVRHLYDVHQILLDTGSSFDQQVMLSLVQKIASSDALSFQKQNPEYEISQREETSRALEALFSDEKYEEWYGLFVDSMIYGDEKPYFRDVRKVFVAMACKSFGIDPSSIASLGM